MIRSVDARRRLSIDSAVPARALRTLRTLRTLRVALPLAALSASVLACGGNDDGSTPTEPPPTPVVSDSVRWAPVDSLARAAVAAGDLRDFSLSIYDARDSLVFERSYGDFSPTRRVPVASASKMISGLVILDAVARGELSLTSTTGDVLGWTGPTASITLQHLLSFTSGLPNETPCVLNPFITLGACVADIATLAPVAPPGTRFDYGNTHLHVAARMAEVATGRTWNVLVRERLTARLGLSEAIRYVTLPQQNLGTTNPLVAGGLWASAREYAAFLRVLYHRGQLGALQFATPALIDAMAREPYPGVVVGASPFADFGRPDVRYGLTAWLECATPATGCGRISSPGAFGFTPWIDRDGRYYAIIAQEQGLFDQAARDGVTLAIALHPSIRTALGPN